MANALESASLVMIPSGYEDGTLGSLKPTDGSGDFTFSRGSDISATRVNADGYIEKGYENTILGSNDFARNDSSYVITNGEAGYDGTNDAWLVNKLSVGNAYFGKNSLVYTGVMTISVYAKAGTLDRLIFLTAGDYVLFDLENVNAYRLGGVPIFQSIELVAGTNDWYRCSMTINKSETNNLLIKPVLNNSGQDAAGTIYIQDAMLNQGLVAYPYKETTTAPVAGGILEDMPRLDYSNGSCPALLLEPQRTNLVRYSEYFGSWVIQSNTTITTNTTETLSPEGLYNASKAVGNGTDGVFLSSLSSAGGDNIKSVYLKGISGGEIVLLKDPNQTNQTKNCTLTNEWKRFDLLDNQTASMGFQIDNIPSSGIYIYGAQLELGSYPTSYIPTYGVSQTRLDDDAINNQVITGARTYFIDGVRANNYFSSAGFFSSNTTELRISFWTNNEIRIRAGESLYPTLIGDNFKIAVSFDGVSNNRVFMNGVFIGETTFAFTSTYENRITGKFEAWKNNQTIIFPTALSDDECIALTTI